MISGPLSPHRDYGKHHQRHQGAPEIGIISENVLLITPLKYFTCREYRGGYKKHFLPNIFGSVSYRGPHRFFPKNRLYIGVIFKVAKIQRFQALFRPFCSKIQSNCQLWKCFLQSPHQNHLFSQVFLIRGVSYRAPTVCHIYGS